MEKADFSHLEKLKIQQRIMKILICGFGITILLQTFYYSPPSFSSAKLPTSIDDMLQRLMFISSLITCIIFFTIKHHFGIYAAYLSFQKSIETIPVLIDLITLLFIYQYSRKDINQQSSSTRLHFSVMLTLTRFILSFRFIHQKCNCRWKRQLVRIVDILLFILVTTSLLQDSHPSIIRIVQKLLLGLIIIQLNNLFCNEVFWISCKRSITLQIVNVFHHILSVRQILALFVLSSYIVFTFYSIIFDENESLFFTNHMTSSLKTFIYSVTICTIVFLTINWDNLQNRLELQRDKILYFSIGFDNVLETTSSKLEASIQSQKRLTTVLTDGVNPRSNPIQSTELKPLRSYTNDKYKELRFSLENLLKASGLPKLQNIPQAPNKKSGSFPHLVGSFFSSKTSESIAEAKSTSLTIENGLIEIEKGDITQQKVDVIIGSSSSNNLRKVLLKVGGEHVACFYNKEYENNPNSLLISTPAGQLLCKRIFFLKWQPDSDPELLRQSIVDLISNVVQNVRAHNYTSIAFPAIGCGGHACSVDIVVKTMIREMKQHIKERKLAWTVKFIIEPNQQNVYDEFCKQLLSSNQPSTLYGRQQSENEQLRCTISQYTDEYKLIINQFDETMKGKYTKIIQLERIQNERWQMQYLAHWKDFRKRLNENTEKLLYHGCPESAAKLIIEDCFNRSFAGVNGTLYGVGVYFSSNASFSHGYTKSNIKGERCMFVARVLVGKTTQGNAHMKIPPLGFDSTTDGNHIYVTYHDAQAYAEYLITYK